jgi:hypothetical protein
VDRLQDCRGLKITGSTNNGQVLIKDSTVPVFLDNLQMTVSFQSFRVSQLSFIGQNSTTTIGLSGTNIIGTDNEIGPAGTITYADWGGIRCEGGSSITFTAPTPAAANSFDLRVGSTFSKVPAIGTPIEGTCGNLIVDGADTPSSIQLNSGYFEFHGIAGDFRGAGIGAGPADGGKALSEVTQISIGATAQLSLGTHGSIGAGTATNGGTSRVETRELTG